jgi:carbamoyl-phosphate synthase large subunit
LSEDGYETIMVNCNPETVSTDYDTSDRLYFEPLTFEDVMSVVDREKPAGVIVQFGGQTPLSLARALEAAGVPIIGTSPESIDLAEDRKRFGALLAELDIPQPESGTAMNVEEARGVAARIGFPMLVRPSYVLGGRGMVVAYDEQTLEAYMRRAMDYQQSLPVLVDRFLEDATEVDVDCLCDGADVLIAGIMEHIEEAGTHSGDSSCVLPAFSIGEEQQETMRQYTYRLARALNVVGLMNVQYAIQDGKVYVLEVNPRASRTVPYVSKATGVPLAKLASRLMVGRKLAEFGYATGQLPCQPCFVKSPVFPFAKFPGVDVILGPEMRSTGEVMGVGRDFGEAFAKAQWSAGQRLPLKGKVFLSVSDRDKKTVVELSQRLRAAGFEIVATRGTAAVLSAAGIPARTVYKLKEGRPNPVDLIKAKQIDLVINTPVGAHSYADEKTIRRAAVQYHVPVITTLSAARAAVAGIEALQRGKVHVISLQELHAQPGLFAKA